MRKCTFQIKSQWGKERFYPMDEEAQLLCDLIKRKTFTKKQIEFLKEHKVEVEIINV